MGVVRAQILGFALAPARLDAPFQRVKLLLAPWRNIF
jgi:hypothetical protein